MSTIAQAFQPPLYWQQFEDLTEGVFQIVFNDPHPRKVGRPGQCQYGVDVIGRQDGDGRLVGIQCKRMEELDANNEPYPGGKISRVFLEDAIKVAREFSSLLDTFVLATTAKRDVNIQRHALELHEESRSNGSFGIQVWFWDDFVTDLNRNHDLQRWYYANVIQVRTPEDQDAIILDLLGEAFARAAFRTPLHQETPLDFVQALKDTQHAINTGELKDRETRRVIRKTVGGRRAISDETVASYLRLADEKLHELRVRFQENVGQGIIQQSGSILQIPAIIQSELTQLRSEAVAAINKALKHAGVNTI